MTKSSNKTTRRSRRARLHVSSAEGLTLDPSDEDWRRIDEAYPFLSDDDRKTITGIANEYLSLAQFEQNAPFRDDVVAWLEATEKSARTFRESISDEGDSGKSMRSFMRKFTSCGELITQPLIIWARRSGVSAQVVGESSLNPQPLRVRTQRSGVSSARLSRALYRLSPSQGVTC